MNQNLNTADRRVRALLIAPVAILLGILIGPGSLGAIVLYAVAAIMLTTSAVGFCPLYALLHWSSRGHQSLTH